MKKLLISFLLLAAVAVRAQLLTPLFNPNTLEFFPTNTISSNIIAGAGLELVKTNGSRVILRAEVTTAILNTSLNTATNGFVGPGITNGLASIAYAQGLTNGFVGIGITNGLASIAYVDSQTGTLGGLDLSSWHWSNAVTYLELKSNATVYATHGITNIFFGPLRGTNASFAGTVEIGGSLTFPQETAERVPIITGASKRLEASDVTVDQLNQLQSELVNTTTFGVLSNYVRGPFTNFVAPTSLDMSLPKQSWDLTNATVITFANTNDGNRVLLLVRNPGGQTLDWPEQGAGFQWLGGTPTNQWTGTNLFVFVQVAGTTIGTFQATPAGAETFVARYSGSASNLTAEGSINMTAASMEGWVLTDSGGGAFLPAAPPAGGSGIATQGGKGTNNLFFEPIVFDDSTTAAPPRKAFRKRRSGGITTGDRLGQIEFQGHDGTGFNTSAVIRATSTGTIGTDRVPSTLIFSTSTDAAPSVLTDRLLISAAGIVTVPGTLHVDTLVATNFAGGSGIATLDGLGTNTTLRASAADKLALNVITLTGSTNAPFRVSGTNGVTPIAQVSTNGDFELFAGGVVVDDAAWFSFRDRSSILSTGDGLLTFTDWAAQNFTRLNFGQANNHYPGLARAGAGFKIVGGDGSTTSTNSLIIPGTLTVTNGITSYGPLVVGGDQRIEFGGNLLSLMTIENADSASTNWVVDFTNRDQILQAEDITNIINLVHSTNFVLGRETCWQLITGNTNRHLYFPTAWQNHILGTNAAMSTILLPSNSVAFITFKHIAGSSASTYLNYPIWANYP